MLSCRELVELVTDFLEGALSPVRHDELLDHLHECDDCLRYLGQLETTRHLLAGLPTGPLPEAERRALLAAYRSWCAARRTVD